MEGNETETARDEERRRYVGGMSDRYLVEIYSIRKADVDMMREELRRRGITPPGEACSHSEEQAR